MIKEEVKIFIENMSTARRAILDDLKHRYDTGDASVKMNKKSRSPYDEGEPQNYLSGSGQIDCPVCKTGKIKYSRAGYNGHVHAGCTTETCVRWMESRADRLCLSSNARRIYDVTQKKQINKRNKYDNK